MRPDGRRPNQLRPLKIKRRYTRVAPGSVLIQTGGTTVLCTASISEEVPPWMKDQNRGWITAEYSMLPGSTSPRKRREREAKLDGRTSEIQRLIGRSLRAVADLDALGRRTVAIDCDVLTLGQYLAPTAKHIPVARFVPPEEFDSLAALARRMGFKKVVAGPFVRSSYHADDMVKISEGIPASADHGS